MKRKVLFFLYPYMLYRGRDETQDLAFSMYLYMLYRGRDEKQDLVFSLLLIINQPKINTCNGQ